LGICLIAFNRCGRFALMVFDEGVALIVAVLTKSSDLVFSKREIHEGNRQHFANLFEMIQFTLICIDVQAFTIPNELCVAYEPFPSQVHCVSSKRCSFTHPARSESLDCQSSCRACWMCAPLPDSGCSTNRGRGMSRRVSSWRSRAPAQWGCPAALRRMRH